jgi:outer membrane protein OmpA-like peptidoglycan-associated protein/Tol biopolymer transport system component
LKSLNQKNTRMYIIKFSRLLVLILTLSFIPECKSQKKGNDTDKPSKHELEGVKLMQKSEYEKAMAMFEKGLKKKPSDRSLLNMLSSMHAQNGDHEMALIYLNSLTNYHPEYANGFFFRAESQYQLMEYQKCVHSIDTFLSKKSPRKDLIERGENLRKRANFAVEMMKNPADITFENLGKNINTKDDEYWPGLTIDEEIFIFTKQHFRREDIFISKKNGNDWGKAIPLPGEVNSMMNEGTVSITADGKYIFYTMCNRKDGYGSCDIYLSILQPDGSFGKPRIVAPPLNTPSWESQPSISPDGLTLYFSSNRSGGYGGKDIWKSSWTGTGFGSPVNLGPDVNTPFDEQAPFIHADGVTLYFSSDGHEETMGGADLYMSRLNGEVWGKPENLGYPINTANNEFGLIVDRKGEYAYFATDRPGGFGGLDIYKFLLPQTLRPEPVSYVKGRVFDKLTKEPLVADIELIDLKTGEISKKTASDKNGTFIIILAKNKEYMFNVDRESYLFFSDNFKLDEGSMEKPFQIEAPLEKPDAGSTLVLNNIFFDVDKFTLKSESKTELRKAYEFLRKFPQMKVEIGGHTDNTGNKERNSVLSENRAKEVMEHLIELGINRNRLSYKGYADSKPITSNDTEAGRAQNRRTEIKIISTQ